MVGSWASVREGQKHAAHLMAQYDWVSLEQHVLKWNSYHILTNITKHPCFRLHINYERLQKLGDDFTCHFGCWIRKSPWHTPDVALLSRTFWNLLKYWCVLHAFITIRFSKYDSDLGCGSIFTSSPADEINHQMFPSIRARVSSKVVIVDGKTAISSPMTHVPHCFHWTFRVPAGTDVFLLAD